MRLNGKVKYYNASKGYGFLTPEDGSKDIFLHVTAIQKSGLTSITEGLALSFEVQNDTRGRGPQAVALEMIGAQSELK